MLAVFVNLIIKKMILMFIQGLHSLHIDHIIEVTYISIIGNIDIIIIEKPDIK